MEEKGAPVIIAGFGRFGQIVGRLLFANGIKAVVLDHDPDQIKLLRKFGYKVFYGDAAGKRNDDVEDDLLLTDIVRKNFRHLKVVARARNVTHYVELRSRGIKLKKCEIFESALKAGREELAALFEHDRQKYEAEQGSED